MSSNPSIVATRGFGWFWASIFAQVAEASKKTKTMYKSNTGWH